MLVRALLLQVLVLCQVSSLLISAIVKGSSITCGSSTFFLEENAFNTTSNKLQITFMSFMLFFPILNVGRDGSQWNYLVDRINTLLGPVIVWIFSSTIVLNILSRSENFPNYLTTSEDGIMSSIEFILWPLWLVSIYLVMVLFAPFTIYLHKKYPYATVLFLITMTILIDNINFALNLSYLKLFNYLFFWIVIHQIGYFFADGKIQKVNINVFRYITSFYLWIFVLPYVSF